MGVMQEIGPAVTLSAREIQILADKVMREARIAGDCAGDGRCHDPARAIDSLKKINALTAGIARRDTDHGEYLAEARGRGGCVCLDLGDDFGTLKSGHCPLHGLRASASPRESSEGAAS